MYRLANVAQREAETRGSFRIPTRSERESLRPGQFAKLVFESENPPRGERMWVKVERVVRSEDGIVSYSGVLDNDPVAFADCLSLGSEISFGPENVCDR